jgi:hypothetical protein
MKKRPQLLWVAPGPEHIWATEPVRGRQTGFGAKAGAPAAVCDRAGTRAGRTGGALGELAALLSLNGRLTVRASLVGGGMRRPATARSVQRPPSVAGN